MVSFTSCLFQTYFLPVIGLVDAEKLKPGDLVVRYEHVTITLILFQVDIHFFVWKLHNILKLRMYTHLTPKIHQSITFPSAIMYIPKKTTYKQTVSQKLLYSFDNCISNFKPNTAFLHHTFFSLYPSPNSPKSKNTKKYSAKNTQK